MKNKKKTLSILMVGGSIRDLLLGKTPNDFDFLVASGSVEDFKKEFPYAKPVGKSYEIFFQKGFEFSFPRITGQTVEETIDLDLSARDFTINGFALDEDGELYAHPNGLEDLYSKTLRPAFAETFKSDPLRVFRAATFLARFPDFTAHPDLITSMREAFEKGWLTNIAPDRIGVELIKALKSDKPGNFVRTLQAANCFEPWFTEFSGSDGITAGPPKFHDKSVLGHISEIMDKVAGNPITCWMATCHDLGKILTPTELLPAHHGHDIKGIALASKLSKRLLLPNKYIKAGELAAELHMKAGNYKELRPATKVDLLMKLHKNDLVKNMRDLCRADKNEDTMATAMTDLAKILKVSLPEQDRNLGKESGKKLRSLRAQKISSKLTT
ncbi:tRNA nucleotidyltransferase (CCA-adding enzyme) [Maridesulfovibrio ferrireducens]|uniref:tRNA nucleotidyltransferase (CCA-adding enzyme) n=1 Tax=Maridesulfovibrio ferrireducens TaxID=246191 RepID=A0A1G9HXB4_9BACT|nr:HD domain-containing protein [Maridesulfovibrio ferrireducens]SDL17620.1 tRNA nucleotidyltransferase (CCA-adding enzyme) [Maridesulfovibrio ferrireducens]